MSDSVAAKSGLMNIGEEAKPPFAVLPDPSKLFLKRSQRFAALAPGHQLEAYLRFLAELTKAQHEIQAALPPVERPSADAMAKALAHGMPALAPEHLASRAVPDIVRALVVAVSALKVSPETAAALEALKTAAPDAMTVAVRDALDGRAAPDDVAQQILVMAALQVHASRLAAQLDADALQPIADGICPACGSPPAASAVVGWPKAHNVRFCVCSLCSTHWNVVRVKCVLCSETGGISYHTIDGQSDAVKAETCANCKHYVKINYQVNHPDLEEFADDVASLGLDLLMRDEGWARGGRNLFLLGY